MKKKTWNQHEVKRENKSLVLETIKNQSPISRADIASHTGLNKGTVSSLVSDLLEMQLISESGPGVSAGGRRPVMLLFNQLAGFTIGIDLGVNYILGVLTDLNGNICAEKTIHFTNLPFEKIIEKLFGVVDLLIAEAPSSPYGIIEIGIAFPGIVHKSGEILLAPNLQWENVYLQKTLEDKYHIPIKIENEANAGAYGERKFGAGKNFSNIIYVSVGIGIGVGLILNGAIYRGNNNFSGELGHMAIKAGGDDCICGSKGCWELYASEKALIKNAEHLGIKPASNEGLSLESLITLAENGDMKTINLFDQVGDYLGIGINNIINIFNPQKVIIGNRISAANKWLKYPLKKRVISQTLWFQQEDLLIDFSELKNYSAALGMTAFSVEHFLKNI